MPERRFRMAEVLRHLAAEFLSRESNRSSLITVTDVDVAKDFGNAIILISVYPETQSGAALEFVKRKRSDLREYIKEHAKLKRMPKLDFAIDEGEKKRQRIDDLLR